MQEGRFDAEALIFHLETVSFTRLGKEYDVLETKVFKNTSKEFNKTFFFK